MISRMRLGWRFFWSRRAPGRTVAGVVFAITSLLATLYLTLPANEQRQIVDAVTILAQTAGSLDLDTALEVGAALCLAVSVILIFVPSYRRPGYLLTANPSLIPPVSVYLDAENQIPESTIRPFIRFLIKHLDGRRADLLYFLDASQSAATRQYKTLYRFGFRPIHVPHDPLGFGPVKEAVDKELAMHAYERALLGPPKQEFIIVTGDGDFVPLVYRLVALGHRVQIWAAPLRPAYRSLATYLDVNVMDLSQAVSELVLASAEGAPMASPQSETTHRNTRQRKRRYERPASASHARILPPTSLSHPGEEQLYHAIAETLSANAEALSRFADDQARNAYFRSLMHGKYAPRLAGVGYNVGSWLDYWLEHLITVGLLSRMGDRHFPIPGSATTQAAQENAARSLFVIAETTAREAAHIGATHDDGNVHMVEIAAAMTANSVAPSEIVAPLLTLVAPDNPRHAAHARYFVRSARAAGLLEYADVPGSLDLIARPRLIDIPSAPADA